MAVLMTKNLENVTKTKKRHYRSFNIVTSGTTFSDFIVLNR